MKNLDDQNNQPKVSIFAVKLLKKTLKCLCYNQDLAENTAKMLLSADSYSKGYFFLRFKSLCLCVRK